MRHTLLWLAAGVLATSLGGCQAIGLVIGKTTEMVQGPPKTTASFSLSGRHVIILVDAANQDLLELHPTIRYRMAMAAARELDRKRAAASIVNPRDLVTYAQTEPDYNRKSTVEIGQHFGADTVLHLVIEKYGLDRATGAETFNGVAVVGLRVIDVEKAEQIYPDMERFQTLSVQSTMGITADSVSQAETKVLEALALKVGMLFAEYEVESLPRNPDVK